MLDLQRQKYASRTNPGILFTRAVVFVHFACGSLAAVAMVFHERFAMAALAALWFLITVGLVSGMKSHHQWCRVCLAVAFELAAAHAFVYLIWVAPALAPETPPLLSLKILPFWLSIWAFAYVAGGLLLLVSKRIERTTMRGFELWPPPPR